MSDMKNFDDVFDGLKDIEMTIREMNEIIDAMFVLGLHAAKHLQYIQTRVLDGAKQARGGFGGFINQQTRAAEQSTKSMLAAALVGAMGSLPQS